jgi:hypothetical protein
MKSELAGAKPPFPTTSGRCLAGSLISVWDWLGRVAGMVFCFDSGIAAFHKRTDFKTSGPELWTVHCRDDRKDIQACSTLRAFQTLDLIGEQPSLLDRDDEKSRISNPTLTLARQLAKCDP